MPDTSLRLKSYFSGTVEAAVDLARRELGEDAFLVNARPASPETRRYGAYEVVFGVEAVSAEAMEAPAVPPPLPPPSHGGAPVETLARDLADLRRQLQHVLQPPEPPPVEQVSTDATLGVPGAGCARVMLVGPGGAGKTTTLLKIAGRYGVHLNKPTHILTTDIYRVAAADQLLTHAAILGVGCDVVEPTEHLERSLEAHAHERLVFIDTPGFALGDMRSSLDLVRAAAACDDLDIHLVLSAVAKPEDALRAADAYSIFRPNKLIFTHLDETIHARTITEVASQLDLPVSFLCAGTRIPEDVEPATRRRIAELAEAVAPRATHRKGAGA